jgi:hypothetical protein
LGWENAIWGDSASKIIGARIKYATRGILWGTEFLAIGLYLLKRLSTTWPTGNAERIGEVFLFALSVTAVAFTLWVMRDQDLRKVIAEKMQNPKRD